MKSVSVGDVISACGTSFEISKVIHQEHWDRFGFDIEFLDKKGRYHHWKQSEDGGRVIRKKKKLVDCYGVDCTDLFIKYGMPL